MFGLHIRKFLERTCLPGFSEMYNAENRFWRIFWFVTVAFSFVMTGYLLVNATLVQFINQPTTTSIQLATTEDLLYLPFRMCYPHWMYWIDFEKALKMKFTKFGTLYGMSYLTKIYSSTKINETEAEQNFHAQMASNNLSTVMDFYQAIAKEPRVFQTPDGKPLSNLTQAELFFGDFNDLPLLCHTIKGENIGTLVTDTTVNNWNSINARKSQLVFQLSYDYTADYLEYIDDNEYVNYVLNYFDERMVEAINLSRAAFPFMFFPTSYGGDGIVFSRNTDLMIITLTPVILNVWKSTKQFPCQENFRWVTTNDTCQLECLKKKLLAEAANTTTPIPIARAVVMNNYSLNILSHGIVYLGGNYSETRPTETTATNTNNVDQYSNAKHFFQQLQLKHEEDCTAICDGLKGCRAYTVDVNQEQTVFVDLPGTSGWRRLTTVVVKYPKETEILIMKEEDAKTWQDFVGNIGGLLGIWTGASIIAFVQLFYLCCCSECHSCVATSLMVNNGKSAEKLPPATTTL